MYKSNTSIYDYLTNSDLKPPAPLPGPSALSSAGMGLLAILLRYFTERAGRILELNTGGVLASRTQDRSIIWLTERLSDLTLYTARGCFQSFLYRLTFINWIFLYFPVNFRIFAADNSINNIKANNTINTNINIFNFTIMNNYLMTGVAAIAFLAAVTSCSRSTDFFDQEAFDERNRIEQELQVNERYAAAFEKAFGKVGSNVDWGFSSRNAGARAITRDGGVVFTTTITFPGDCNASNFLKAVPEGTKKLPADGGGASSWYIDASTTKVRTWAGASKVYVTGTVDLSAGDTNAADPRFQVSTTSEIYLLEGATLKIGKASAENFIGAAVYIAEGATLETDYPLLLNSGIDVYNHGTINVKNDLQVNTNSILYNSGTVKATGTVSAESNSSNGDQSSIVNNGSIECADVVVNAGAVLNIFEWKVSGTTKINSNNSGWINNGKWTTKDYAYVGGSENVINNCYLWVTNDFEMNISSLKGSFKINSEGGVLAQNFYGGRDSSTDAISGPFKIEMAENAVFVVENDAQFESGRGEIDNDKYAYGIFGPLTGGYAVFQAKNIVRDTYLESINSWGAVTYRGHLYVSAETHFAQGNDGQDAHKFIIEQDGFSIDNNIYAAGFKSGKPNINIPQTSCSPGFKGGDPLYRVIAEDLSASEDGDFDFNDVVFDVVKAEGGVTTLKLICAGGVLPLRVMGVEVHSIFGETTPNEKGEYKMYNTGAGPNVDPVTFEVPGTYTTPEEIRNIIIEVKKNDKWMELKAETGKAACKILVDDTFVPVEERKNIADKNGNFTDYVQGKFVDDFWWK